MKGLSTKTRFATALLSLAALGSTAARADGVQVLDEGFASVANLNGWVQMNDSTPPGNAWFQGNSALFPAQAGAPDAYAAASFLSAANGMGHVDNWLITPTLDLSGLTTLSFFTRSAGEPGFNDVLELRFSSGAGTDAAGFTTLLTTVGGAADFPSAWTRFSASLAITGSGRFAFRYVGPADILSQVGLDSVSVVTAVPEPASWMMLAMGAGLLPLLGRSARPSRPARNR
ncbi:MAG TPA: choice-of-anchor J domain-containing protein [Telluria sp.]